MDRVKLLIVVKAAKSYCHASSCMSNVEVKLSSIILFPKNRNTLLLHAPSHFDHSPLSTLEEKLDNCGLKDFSRKTHRSVAVDEQSVEVEPFMIVQLEESLQK